MAEGMFGPYRLDGLLGRGGMGEVYRAFDTRKRNRVVALKLLPESLSADEEFRARFQREAEIAATLSEPHVIPIHDYGEIDGRLYLDMRIVDGADLATVLHRDGPFAAERAVAIIEQIAAALDAAHDDGLIHRDVKPSNVLVRPGPPEFVYLVDFGIARPALPTTGGRLTSSGMALGTLDYMAPEQFLARPLDHRVDVYALACVLFEILAGRPPYVGAAPALMHGHLTLPAPVLSEHRTGLSPALDEVITCGMSKEPDDRHATAGALAATARTALAPKPITAPPRAAAPAVTEPTRPDAATMKPAAEEPMPDDAYPETLVSSQPTPAATARRSSRLTTGVLVPAGIGGVSSAIALMTGGERVAPGLLVTLILLIIAISLAVAGFGLVRRTGHSQRGDR